MTILTGLFTLGRDAELRSTNNGDQVATLALAYNYGRKGQDGKQPTQWVDAALWGDRAAKTVEYLTKGKQINAVLSDVHIQTFRKSDGSDGFKLAARVNDFEFARGPRQENAAPPAQAPQRRAPAPAPAQRRSGSGFDDMSSDLEDIPFRDPLARRGMHLAVA